MTKGALFLSLFICCASITAQTRVVTLVASVNTPTGIATDPGGNLYVSAAGNSAVLRRDAFSQQVSIPIHAAGAHLVAVDRFGNVYFQESFGSNSVKKWNAVTHAITTLIEAMNTIFPAAMAADDDGNLYFADPAGEALWTWSAATGALKTRSATMAFENASGVAVDRSGNVYVATTETLAKNGTILKVNPTTFVETIATTGVPREPRLTADAAGNLYMSDRENNAIRKLNVSTRLVTTMAASGLNAPFDVSADSAGNLFIADADGIKRWDATTQRVTTVIGENLRQPWAVAVDSYGNVYVTDTGGYDGQAGSALKVWSRATQQLSTVVPLIEPQGVAIDARDNIYASDLGGVYRVDPATSQLATLFSGFPNRPAGIAVDALQHIYAAFPHYQTVARLDGFEKLLIPNLNWPVFVAVDRSGNLYISDTLSSTVRKWDASTHSVLTIGSRSDLSEPAGVAVDGYGNVFVADTDAGAIKKWSPLTLQWTTVAAGLDGPVGIALGRDGTLYFTETGASALKAIVPIGRHRAAG